MPTLHYSSTHCSPKLAYSSPFDCSILITIVIPTLLYVIMLCVHCVGNKEDPMYGSLRLLNAAGSYGSLHVFDGILFHPVCDSGFGWNELIVACRQLGYNRALQIVNNSL